MTQTIEQLTARVRELEEENARLRADNIAFARNLKGKSATTGATYEHICTQLAASQLHAEQLREALENHSGNYKLSKAECKIINDLLDKPHDTSALDAYVAEKMKISRDIDEKQIAYLFEERSLLTRQRDLAVEALEWALSNINCEPFEWSDEENADAHKAAIEALSTIKESEK